MINKLITGLCLVFFVGVYGQPLPGKALKPGDQAPDLVFRNHMNFKHTNPKLSDLRGKLVILDFWGTFCTACINAFPKMDSLQQKYPDNILVILVNARENRLEIDEKFKKIKNPEVLQAFHKMPQINADERWYDFFPHRSLPHHVWINQDGVIVAITNGYNTNENNIDKFFEGKTMNFPVKDDYFNQALKEGLLVKNEQLTPALYSAFFDYIPNFKRNNVGVDSLNQTYFRTFANQQLTVFISNLLSLKDGNSDRAGHDLRTFNVGGRRIISKELLARLSSAADKSLYQSWIEKYIINYEIQVPFALKDKAYEIAFENLMYYSKAKLGVELKTQFVKKKCYLVKITDNERLKTKGGKSQDKISDTLTRIVNMRYSTLQKHLFNHLENKKGIPVIFESNGLNTNIDIEIKGNLSNYKALKKELKRYNIELVKTKRDIEYLRFIDLE